MEQGTIIAIVSLVVTATVAIWSKLIDSKQKVKEHNLSLRSIYITKKINAGEDIVNKNALRIIDALFLRRYLMHLKTTRQQDAVMFEKSKQLIEMTNALAIDKNHSHMLFFRFKSLATNIELLIARNHQHYVDINPYIIHLSLNPQAFNKEFEDVIDAFLITNQEFIDALKEINNVVRDELDKYDIV